MKAADDLFRSHKWQEAASIYEQILKADPTDAAALHQLAMARYSMKDWDAAIAAFQKSIAVRDESWEMFNIACAFALKGEKAQALTWLARAINHPKAIPLMLNLNDPDLQTLRGDPTFQALSEQLERAKAPCMFKDEARQFDFWIGEWDCFNPQGRQDGTSVIERFAGGCGILENWTGTFGGAGKSINFYDPVDGKWFQYWIGQNGVPIRLSGTFRDGAMRYESAQPLPDGSQSLIHLTFTKIDDDTVRQLSEASTNGGKTWTVNYDYKYVRKSRGSTSSSSPPMSQGVH